MQSALRREEELEDDATEGIELEPLTPFSSPLSPLPQEYQSPPSDDLPPLPPPALPFPPAQAAWHSLPRRTVAPIASNSSTPGQSIEQLRKKARSKSQKAVARLMQKRAANFGDYAVKPKVLNHHVRGATAVDTKLNTKKLGHTKNGYTGARDKGGHRRVYGLAELVGDQSLGFKLQPWDGK